jgi:hypothetical protein
LNCKHCGEMISPERLLLEFDTCIKCSTEPKRVGFMDITHKTGSSIVILDPRDQEAVRRASRINRRDR